MRATDTHDGDLESMNYFRRPRTLEVMAKLRQGFDNREGMAKGLAYRPGPDEILIATYPKSGTTWLQQILHALRTRGSMAFSEITEVVPWLEMAHALGQDPRAPQVAAPRVFKTHLSWEQIPKGARYIHVTRDPRDALVSSYHFMQGWFLERGAVDIDTFARARFLQGAARAGGYWAYLLSWWPHRHDDNVLMLTYEDMLAEPEQAIERIADFAGIPLDAELAEIVRERSSLAFMKAHDGQFDDHLVRAVLDRACNLEPGGDSSKVRQGKSGAHRCELSPAVVEELQARWDQTIGSALGFADYPALRAAIGALS